uniref:Crystallin gamma N n=1 Tax=Chelonoidis abingdonii TaxID=106734 RepID=A0A8C0IN11_CHEAB
ITASSPSSFQITFYEGKYFTGRKLKVCGNCDNFQDRGFMNRVNSICVQSGAWISFDHPDFQGQQYVLEHGEYPGFYRCNGYNDHKGSCRPVGIVRGEDITEWRHFSGHCMEFTEECSFLQGQGWNKNCVNAIKVWVLYEEPNYHGRMYVVERGEYNSLNTWQAHSANIQSLRRVVNYF